MTPMPSRLQIHSVLYGTAVDDVRRSVRALSRAVEQARAAGLLSTVTLRFGDCSPTPVFSDESRNTLRCDHPSLTDIEVQFFGANLGSAAGHNRLLEVLDCDYVLIVNPDTVVAPNCLIEMFAPFAARSDVGLVEAGQLPFEHPKDYDPSTGETSWASTACALVPASVIAQVGGFDSDTFFLYCDDVDWSWRIRLSGRRLILAPRARLFHDKRVDRAGRWIVGAAEEYFSAEASLLMAHKWGRPDLVGRYSHHMRQGTDAEQRAVAAFEQRALEGRLPEPVAGAAEVATFVVGDYSNRRF